LAIADFEREKWEVMRLRLAWDVGDISELGILGEFGAPVPQLSRLSNSSSAWKTGLSGVSSLPIALVGIVDWKMWCWAYL